MMMMLLLSICLCTCIFNHTKNYSSETDKHKKMESANLNSGRIQDVLEEREKKKKIKKKKFTLCEKRENV